MIAGELIVTSASGEQRRIGELLPPAPITTKQGDAAISDSEPPEAAMTRVLEGWIERIHVEDTELFTADKLSRVFGDSISSDDGSWSQRRLAVSVRMVPGSAWVKSESKSQGGRSQPQRGSEIVHEGLSAALKGGKERFSLADLAALKLPRLTFDSYISAGDSYYEQLTSEWGDGESFESFVEMTVQGMAAAAGERVHVLLDAPLCGTITRHDTLGLIECAVDNAPSGERPIVLTYDATEAFVHDPDRRPWDVRVGNASEARLKCDGEARASPAVFLPPPVPYATGQKLLLVRGGRLTEVSVVSAVVSAPMRPTRHICVAGATGDGPRFSVELNAFNHCVPRFTARAAYYEAIIGHCRELERQTEELEDGITGVRLKTVSQTLKIQTQGHVAQAKEQAMHGSSSTDSDDAQTVTDLAGRMLAPSPSRERGVHPSRPVLLCANAGTGKTWSSVQLAHELATRCQRQDSFAADGVPLVPLLVYVQRLVRLMGERPADAALLVQYVAREHSNGLAEEERPKWVAMVAQALELRSLVLVLDGIDEAAGQRDAISRFIREVLVPHGLRVICTSRPEGVTIGDFQKDFTVMDLVPISEEQQREALELQLKDSPQGKAFSEHLTAFATIRRKHDELYRECFADDERAAIEKWQAPDKLVLEAEDSQPKRRDPEMRQRAADGTFVKRSCGPPKSRYHRTLASFFTEGVLRSLDAVLYQEAAADVERAKIEALVEQLPHDGVAHLQERYGTGLFERSRDESTDDAKHTRAALKREPTFEAMGVAVKLGLLLLERRRRLEGRNDADEKLRCAAPQATALKLWPAIVARTDEIYVALEDLKDLFEEAVKQLAADHALAADGDVIFGGLKDAVRIHEKALGDYLDDFDDWADDYVLPEACVLDVLRVRIVCLDAKTVLALQDTLKGGVEVDVGGGRVRLEVIRCKNKFGVCDPTHFRNILNNVRLTTHDGREAFVEVQVQHQRILQYNNESHAHDHFDFFRSLLAATYDKGLDAMLEKTVRFFAEIRGVPVKLSMLVLLFKHRCAGDTAPLPTDPLELYWMAMKLSSTMETVGMLQTLAIANMCAGRREFTSEHAIDAFEAAMRSASYGSNEAEQALALWQRLLQDDGAIPLVKVLETDAIAQRRRQGLFQFKHLSFQEALYAQHLVDTNARDLVVWADDARYHEFVTNPFHHQTMLIGGGRLGVALARVRPKWELSSLDASATAAVRALLDGNNELTGLRLQSCHELEELPELAGAVGLTSIGDGAFAACSSLSAIELPSSLTSIGDGAFVRCSSLSAI